MCACSSVYADCLHNSVDRLFVFVLFVGVSVRLLVCLFVLFA